ncbi:MAG: manganese efflux pump MntP [Thermoguttaceae bacterium]
MNWWALLGIALALAMDAFAVSIAAGLTVAPVTARHTFRMAFHFGLFQFLMPVIGWLAGVEASQWVGRYDHWVAFVLLTVVAGRMLLEAARDPGARSAADPTRGWLLVGLSVATSLDALAVGFSMALLEVSVWLPGVVIGLVAGTLSAVGILFGARLGGQGGRWARLAGGCILIAIGLRILFDHLSQ